MMRSSTPLYSQIQHYIIDCIRNGEWKVHSQIPPERLLAEQFNVSRITAKNAVVGLVHRGYLYRHRGKGTFVAETSDSPISAEGVQPEPASSQRPNRKRIGFLIPWMEARYSFRLLAGIEAELDRRGYQLIFRHISDKEHESQSISEFLEIPVDGFIIVASPGEHFNDDIIRLILDKFPVVLVEKTMNDMRTNGVYCDTQRVGALMAGFLASCGHTDQVGLIAYPPEYTFGMRERIQGFRAGLAEHGMAALPDEHILLLPAQLLEQYYAQEPETAPAELLEFIASHPSLRALATADALLAQLAGIACVQLDRADIRIVCCDEPTYNRSGMLPDAYVDQMPLSMGMTAAQMLMDAIEGQSEQQKTMMAPRLVSDLSSPKL